MSREIHFVFTSEEAVYLEHLLAVAAIKARVWGDPQEKYELIAKLQHKFLATLRQPPEEEQHESLKR